MQNDLKRAENEKSQVEKMLQQLSETAEVRAAETTEVKALLEKQLEDIKKLHDEEKVRPSQFIPMFLIQFHNKAVRNNVLLCLLFINTSLQEKTAKLELEKKTLKSALDREVTRRETEGDDVKQLQGQLDIVMNKLKQSKVSLFLTL